MADRRGPSSGERRISDLWADNVAVGMIAHDTRYAQLDDLTRTSWPMGSAQVDECADSADKTVRSDGLVETRGGLLVCSLCLVRSVQPSTRARSVRGWVGDGILGTFIQLITLCGLADLEG